MRRIAERQPGLLTPPARKSVPFPLLLALLALGSWLLLRVALWLTVGPAQMTAGQSAGAFARGLWFDLATLAYLLAPWLLLSAVLPNRWRGQRWSAALYWGLATLVLFTLLFGAVSEYVFWDEFSTRFNFIAVDYLIYTHEVVGNILQSYPVGGIVAGIAACALAVVWLLSRRIAPRQAPLSARGRAALLLLAVALPPASWQLADVDQMQASGNAYADELSGNGLFTLASAMRRNELDYDRFYRTLPQERADAILAGLGVQRRLHPRHNAGVTPPPAAMGPFSRHPRNIVLISVESLSARYLGAYGNQHGLTPNLDRLAAAGLRFDQLYATGTRTVRGLEALSLGTPPIPGQAIVRRPHNEHLATMGEILEHQGYATFFIYGGYGYFDNMNAYFRGNDYRVVDRTDFPARSIVFENIWGVADEVLYADSLPVLDEAARAGRPFFAHLMTTSNHRPYTYPDGRIDIPSPGGRKGAIKYTDYAIGQFIEQARGKPWFKDTLFVIVADHCASVAGKSKLPMAHYRIPLIFYAPGMLKPGTYTRMASQIDVVPTLLDVLGVQGSDHYFGQSLFVAAGKPERVFVSNYQELGYYRDGLLTVLSPQQRAQAYRIAPGKKEEATPAELDQTRLAEAIAYYQTAARAFKQGALREPEPPALAH